MEQVYLVINPEGIIERVEPNKEQAYNKETYVQQFNSQYYSVLEVKVGTDINELVKGEY